MVTEAMVVCKIDGAGGGGGFYLMAVTGTALGTWPCRGQAMAGRRRDDTDARSILLEGLWLNASCMPALCLGIACASLPCASLPVCLWLNASCMPARTCSRRGQDTESA